MDEGAADVAQQEHSNNKYYVLAFRYNININIDIDLCLVFCLPFSLHVFHNKLVLELLLLQQVTYNEFTGFFLTALFPRTYKFDNSLNLFLFFFFFITKWATQQLIKFLSSEKEENMILSRTATRFVIAWA